jgi:hypothetical protein
MRDIEKRCLDIRTIECPGGPDEGCCEFCPGPCQTIY